MTKATALETIDKELGVDGNGSTEYEELKRAMFNWFNSNELEQFAEFIEDENR